MSIINGISNYEGNFVELKMDNNRLFIEVYYKKDSELLHSFYFNEKDTKNIIIEMQNNLKEQTT